MKVSVSIPAEDVEFLDTYARDQQITSRSAVLHRAIQLLRASALSADYAAAFDELSSGSDGQPWDHVVADGLSGD